MKINKKLGDTITVKWFDACSRGSTWMPVDDALKVPDEVIVKTRGYYIGHDSGFLTIADSVGNTMKNDVGGVWHIPIKWIKKIR